MILFEETSIEIMQDQLLGAVYRQVQGEKFVYRNESKAKK